MSNMGQIQILLPVENLNLESSKFYSQLLINMAEEILIPPANHRGWAMDWTFLEAFPTMELLMASCHENGFNKERVNVTATSRKR